MIKGNGKMRTEMSKSIITVLACFVWLFLCATISPVFATGLNGDESYTQGPNVCGKCHPEQFNEWLTNGHGRKLAVGPIVGTLDGSYGITADARSMGIPLPDHDPDVYNWDNILMVIGASKHWKTRYVDFNGYIITKGGKNQYNWETGSFVDYDKDETKKYSCGPCHTTGYRAEGSFGIEGIVGDFAQLNITCEACHGPGAAHAASPSKDNIVVDTSAELCGKCHIRGDDPTVIIASGGFIKHHEQYPEFLNSPHRNLNCVTCHDPHVGRAQGIKVAEGKDEICETCHSSQVEEYKGSAMQLAGVKCQDCHMGKATKSAVKNGPYEGDVWTHLFRINTSADYTMFSEDGATAKDALSLEFACFRCHAGASKAEFAAIGSSGTAYHTIGKQQ